MIEVELEMGVIFQTSTEEVERIEGSKSRGEMKGKKWGNSQGVRGRECEGKGGTGRLGLG